MTVVSLNAVISPFPCSRCGWDIRVFPPNKQQGGNSDRMKSQTTILRDYYLKKQRQQQKFLTKETSTRSDINIHNVNAWHFHGRTFGRRHCSRTLVVCSDGILQTEPLHVEEKNEKREPPKERLMHWLCLLGTAQAFDHIHCFHYLSLGKTIDPAYKLHIMPVNLRKIEKIKKLNFIENSFLA